MGRMSTRGSRARRLVALVLVVATGVAGVVAFGRWTDRERAAWPPPAVVWRLPAGSTEGDALVARAVAELRARCGGTVDYVGATAGGPLLRCEG